MLRRGVYKRMHTTSCVKTKISCTRIFKLYSRRKELDSEPNAEYVFNNPAFSMRRVSPICDYLRRHLPHLSAVNKHHDAGRYRPGVLMANSLGWADTNAAIYLLTPALRTLLRRLALPMPTAQVAFTVEQICASRLSAEFPRPQAFSNCKR